MHFARTQTARSRAARISGWEEGGAGSGVTGERSGRGKVKERERVAVGWRDSGWTKGALKVRGGQASDIGGGWMDRDGEEQGVDGRTI